MGKKTDRMYITMKEWAEDFGGKVKKLGVGNSEFRPLPYYCCSLSLQPFEDPVSTSDGTIFEITNILPWIQKHKVNPINGKPMTSKDLFPLHFHKNEQGKFHCPITFKEFTDFSHIVVVRPTGNVYSNEAIEELNIKAKNWKDLLTDTPFTRQDIITLQDPKDLEKRNTKNFHFIKTGMKLVDDHSDPLDNIQISETKKKMLREVSERHNAKLAEKKKAEKDTTQENEENEQYTYVSGSAPSLTSTTFQSEKMKIDAREVSKFTDKKGYVRLQTSLGDINLELHCDMAPKTCENFLGLCERGFYKKSIFHRLIPGFMIQGGDPSGTGRGGESIWGKPFKDEFSPRLQHSARGILSMANTGANTNRSQFFLTFEACSKLDFKHTVFGKVVGGLDVLSRMESVPTDSNDRPLEDITLLSTIVYVNPFKPDPVMKKEEEEQIKRKKEDEQRHGEWYSNPLDKKPSARKTGVGKYIDNSSNSSFDSTDIASKKTTTTITTEKTNALSTTTMEISSSTGTKRTFDSLLMSLPKPAKKHEVQLKRQNPSDSASSFGNFESW